MVLCTRDRPALLEGSLSSILSTRRPGDDVIVVDSASRDGATREVATAAGVRVVRCAIPGLSRARNAGVAATTAPVIAFTDDDCRVEPGWTAAIERAFSVPAVGFVSGRVLPDVETGGCPVARTDVTPECYTSPADPMHMGHGANMAVRRVALDGVGGFDETLGAGGTFPAGEDHDLFWRLLRAGWEGRYTPEATVSHRPSLPPLRFLRKELEYGLGGGALAVKVARVDGVMGWRMLGARLWGRGLVQAWQDLRRGYEAGAMGNVVRVGGVMAGATRALRFPIEGGRLRARAARSDGSAGEGSAQLRPGRPR